MTDEQGPAPVAAPAVPAPPRAPTQPAPPVTDTDTDTVVAPDAAPGPHPPVPSPSPAVPVTYPAVPEASAEPARWGRVDDDGTVWLTADPAGERAVGSWQAGEGAEGLAHFALRFDDLRTEVDLLVRRLQSGRGDARGVGRTAGGLREGLAGAAGEAGDGGFFGWQG